MTLCRCFLFQDCELLGFFTDGTCILLHSNPSFYTLYEVQSSLSAPLSLAPLSSSSSSWDAISTSSPLPGMRPSILRQMTEFAPVRYKEKLAALMMFRMTYLSDEVVKSTKLSIFLHKCTSFGCLVNQRNTRILSIMYLLSKITLLVCQTTYPCPCVYVQIQGGVFASADKWNGKMFKSSVSYKSVRI